MFTLKETPYQVLSPIKKIHITATTIYAFDNDANYYIFDKNNKVKPQRGQIQGYVRVSAICSKYMAIRSRGYNQRNNVLMLDWTTEEVKQIDTGINFTNLCFTDDCEKIVVCAHDRGIIQIYSTKTSDILKRIEPEQDQRGYITSIATTNTHCMYFFNAIPDLDTWIGEDVETVLQIAHFNSPQLDFSYPVNFYCRCTPIALDDKILIVGCSDDTIKVINLDTEGLITQVITDFRDIELLAHYDRTVLIRSNGIVSMFKFVNNRLEHIYNIPDTITHIAMYGSLLVYSSTNLLNRRSIYDINNPGGKKILRNTDVHTLTNLCNEDQINAVRYVISHHLDSVLNTFRRVPLDDASQSDHKKIIDPELIRFLLLLIFWARGKSRIFLEQYKALVESENFPAHITDFVAPWLVKLKY